MKKTFRLCRNSIGIKFLISLLVLTLCSKAYSITLVEYQMYIAMTTSLSGESNSNCGHPIVTLSEGEYINLNSLTVDLTVTALNAYHPIFFQNSVLFQNEISLSNTDYFEYLGAVTFDQSDIDGSTIHCFRFIFSGYNDVNYAVTSINLGLKSGGEGLRTISSFKRQCAGGLVSSRSGLINLYSRLPLLTGCYSFPYPGYGVNFSELSNYSKQAITKLMNWCIESNLPSQEDYLDVLNPGQLTDPDLPSSFATNQADEDLAQYKLILFMRLANNILSDYCRTNQVWDNEAWSNAGAFGNMFLNMQINSLSLFHCYLPVNYFFIPRITYNGNGYELTGIPLFQSGCPILSLKVVYDFDDSAIYSSLAYSYSEQRPTEESLLENSSAIAYEGNGEFSYADGFAPAREDAMQPFPAQ